MSARGIVALVALAGCGRVNFDLLADATALTDADPLQSGLIAWYRMEAVIDGTLEDSAGGNHHATCIVGTTCPTTVAGPVGNAASFDMQCARVTYGAWLDTPTAFSFTAWLFLDQVFDQVAFGKAYGAIDSNAWSIVSWTPANGPGLCMESIAANMFNESACGPYATAGTWFHVAARWTGQTKEFFVDGVQVGQLDPATVALMDAHDFTIGCDENGGSPALHWYGRIDELRLYNRALSNAEIMVLAGR